MTDGIDLEIQVYGMTQDANGDWVLVDALDRHRTAERYDVELRKLNHTTGEVEILEEHDDLDYEKALSISDELADKHGCAVEWV